MRSQLIRILEKLAAAIPAAVYPGLVRRTGIDIFYHAVSDQSMEHARHLYPVVPVDKFEEALRYLGAHYQFVGYSHIHAQRTHGEALPSKALHLSFDDGFQECFSVVRPLLLEHSIPCTFFVATDWIDNQTMFYRNKISLCIEQLNSKPTEMSKLDGLNGNLASLEGVTQWLKELRMPDEPLIDEVCQRLDVDWVAFLKEQQPYLTTAQIQQMHAEGFTIGAHTKSHRKLVTLNEAEIEEEIVDSCRAIQKITGQEIVPFSFPNSAFGVDRGLLFSICVQNPMVGLLFDTKGVRKDENFIVNRVWAERPLSPERTLQPLPEILHNAYQEAWVEGVMDWARRIRS
jgi:peptidoglycan/xylan/chitin deacetylase (PgdA/CDA1 family)